MCFAQPTCKEFSNITKLMFERKKMSICGVPNKTPVLSNSVYVSPIYLKSMYCPKNTSIIFPNKTIFEMACEDKKADPKTSDDFL
jgi:hypothetical protein